MSKAIKTDMDFNKDTFAELLNLELKEKKQTLFAKKCGLSQTSISQYKRAKRSTPPMPKTIKKIADVCENPEITYEKLLQAAGYDPKKYIQSNNSSFLSSAQEDKMKATIALALTKLPFSWTYCKPQKKSSANIIIETNDSMVGKYEWHFYFLNDFSDTTISDFLNERIFSYYGKFLFLQSENPIIFSLVTSSPEVFHTITEIKPYLLAAYLSIILVDTESQTILDEKCVDTSKTLTEDSRIIYSLL